MTETLPVPVAPTRLDEFARLGQWLALSESGSETEKAKGASAALRLFYASELGLSPMAAAELTVIRGRLYVGAQLLRALAIRGGYRVFKVTGDTESCTARLVRDGQIMGEATFTLEDARKAGLIRNGSPWQTHPARMLWARASKNVIIDFAPEVALGLALEDELVEMLEPVDEADDDIPFGESLDSTDEYEAEIQLAEELAETDGD